MASLLSKAALLAVLMSAGAQAQNGAYGQCGGVSWTGSTTCVSGYTCTYSNPYYSQCLPGTASSSSSKLTTSTSAKTTSTSKAVTTTSKTTTSAVSTGTGGPGTGTKYFFTFGDSYSQTGFDPTLTYASAANPLGNPAFPGYTTDNGANWIGKLVEGLNTSLTLSYNFAYGGATVNASLVAPYETTVLSLIDQVSEFTKYVASKPASTPWTSANSLFGVWLGVNDIGNSYYTGSTEPATITAILNSYFGQVQILYNAGARYFVFLTVPPIQKTPLMLADTVADQTLEAQYIASFNSELSTMAANFAKAHTGTTYWVYDTQVPFNTAINNPTAYGAADATCYNSDGVSCLWWNNYHPGQAIQTLVAKGVAAALKGTFF